jgi:hypothetical protein
MKIDLETWNELSRLTQERVAEANKRAQERGDTRNVFEFRKSTAPGNGDTLDIIITSHKSSEYCTDKRGIARERETGNLFKCKFSQKGTKAVPAPKAWAKAKTADEIRNIAKLNGYLVVIGASVTTIRDVRDEPQAAA